QHKKTIRTTYECVMIGNGGGDVVIIEKDKMYRDCVITISDTKRTLSIHCNTSRPLLSQVSRMRRALEFIAYNSGVNKVNLLGCQITDPEKNEVFIEDHPPIPPPIQPNVNLPPITEDDDHPSLSSFAPNQKQTNKQKKNKVVLSRNNTNESDVSNASYVIGSPLTLGSQINVTSSSPSFGGASIRTSSSICTPLSLASNQVAMPDSRNLSPTLTTTRTEQDFLG
ncbi:hypothetical protein RFI_20031, partial [Reticulomyxa filosa]